MKITERVLTDMCNRINKEQLKLWDSGLKVERRGEEYVVLRLFRKPQKGRSGSLDIFRGSPREAKSFIEGFVNAAGIANNGAAGGARIAERCYGSVE